jgi:hypothetical protein
MLVVARQRVRHDVRDLVDHHLKRLAAADRHSQVAPILEPSRAPAPRVTGWLTVVDSIDDYHMADPEVLGGCRRDCLVGGDAGRRVRHKPDAKQPIHRQNPDG